MKNRDVEARLRLVAAQLDLAEDMIGTLNGRPGLVREILESAIVLAREAGKALDQLDGFPLEPRHGGRWLMLNDRQSCIAASLVELFGDYLVVARASRDLGVSP